MQVQFATVRHTIINQLTPRRIDLRIKVFKPLRKTNKRVLIALQEIYALNTKTNQKTLGETK